MALPGRELRFGGLLISFLLMPWACSSAAVDVSGCKQIEEARCRRAPACGVSLATPPHPDDDVAACIRFYDVACDHGLQTTTPPSAAQVNACVAAINTSDCSAGIVSTPEAAPACAWLAPPPPADAGVDAAVDAGADSGTTDGGDAATDAPVDSTTSG